MTEKGRRTPFPLPLRGEIWRVDFSPGRGSEQLGVRPALVLQNDIGNQNARYPNTVVLAMSRSGKAVPFHVPIAPHRRNGLSEPTFVKCEQVLTLCKARLTGGKALGRVSADEMRRIETAVKLSLGLW